MTVARRRGDRHRHGWRDGRGTRTADAAVLHGRVRDIAGMIELSRATMAHIWQNITLSLSLKAVFIVTTVIGITGLWPTILADTGDRASYGHAMRLLGWRYKA
jgi:Cd2+/Zn2+-exporting ATPase